MPDFDRVFAATSQGLTQQTSWRDALTGMYHVALMDHERDDPAIAALWHALDAAELEDDQREVRRWVATSLDAVRDTDQDTLHFELGDAPEAFRLCAFCQPDPGRPTFAAEALRGLEVVSFGPDPRELHAMYPDWPPQVLEALRRRWGGRTIEHHVSELSWAGWERMFSLRQYALWLGFVALAARDEARARLPGDLLGRRRQLHLMAGFEESTGHIGTINSAGWSSSLPNLHESG